MSGSRSTPSGGTFEVKLDQVEDDLVEVLVRSPRGDVVRKLLGF